MAALAFGAADTPNPGLKYYYPAPEAPVVDVEADIIVYGGTSGGVTAAVQAARQGNSVALVVFGRHVGGLTSGGLTATDGVNANVQGGLTREFFDITGNAGFKPSRAENAFEFMLGDPVPGEDWDAPIPTYYEQRLESVEKDGSRILALHMENGSVFRGRMFIDCTYEGDLMALADVPYTYGREAQSVYGESLAGRHSSVSLPGVDPYIVEGDPSSGLIYNLMPDEGEGPVGAGDDHIQAYNFRMFTVHNTDPSKRQPLFKPEGYDASKFEILYRYHKNGGSTSMQIGNDINNHELFNRGVATDHIGGNRWSYDGGETWIPWADADYATRELMYQSHVNWQLGMLWYVQNDPDYAALATDPSLPQARRDNIAALIAKMQNLGLPLGEYPETGGWTHELYVREARRMVSDFIVTQKHYDRELPVVDSVGLANYRADAHHSRRFVSDSGTVRIEGDTGGNTHTPWQIPYRALTPPEDKASNLLVPWAISASHVAFCSMRMEPCFMVLSQSSAIAAGLAIDQQQSVQQLDYEALRPLLLGAGQILGERPIADTGIIIDNNDSDQIELTGEWLSSTSTGGYYGVDYLHDVNEGDKSVTFRPDFAEAGNYQVHVRWTAHANRATNAQVTVTHADGEDSTTVNQQTDGGQWRLIGEYPFNAGTSGAVTLSNEGADGYVIADAVRFTQAADLPSPVINVVATNPIAHEQGNQPARIQFVRDNVADPSALTLNLSLSGDAVAGEDHQALPSTITIPSNALSAELWVTPIADDIADGPRELNVTIQPVAGYELGASPEATVTIIDKPKDAWRHQQFSPNGQENDPNSAPDADPDGDARTNLLERFFGTDPNDALIDIRREPRIVWELDNDRLWLGLAWNRAGSVDDLQHQVYYSTSLGGDSWQPLQTPVKTASWSPDTGDRSMIQLLDATELSEVFFKIEVEEANGI